MDLDGFRSDLDKRRAEKQQMEEEQRKHNMEKLRRDMEQSGGQSVVLITDLKDKGQNDNMVEEDEDIEDDDFETFTDKEDVIDEDEDEEVGSFSF
jgi:hypothetical protein